jgi:hypothetical protein
MLDKILMKEKITKNAVTETAERLITLMESGKTSAIKTLTELDFINQVVTKVVARARELAVDELSSYGAEASQGVTIHGVSLKIIEAGTKYDFAACNHPEWVQIVAQETALAERRKEIETMLKTLKTGQTIVNEDTGEISRITPPVKSSKTTVQVTIPKN